MIYLVTGGSGSGKSSYAEQLLTQLPHVDRRYYIATMQVYGEEGVRRVERHRRMREGKGFLTLEQETQVWRAAERFEAGCRCAAMIECMSNLTANEMFGEKGQVEEEEVVRRTVSDVKRLSEYAVDLIIVTNQVFDDGISYEESTMAYIRALGRINILLARWADQVTEVTAGIPVIWKKPGGERAE